MGIMPADRELKWQRVFRRFGLPGDRYRFDVIAVLEGQSSTSPQLTHIEDAWRGVGK